ncbi:MAG: 16S rRNA (cytidine(1402)-2'-O)-methyltransferase [Elusimicrobia bacterium CG_4_9_14_3_um_filter_62_55]|nr:MAG: 16S rRNA (cytidine(1402)-2'-O)-methyltransferase [Elusimicrobia bacterium CG22_combo_CG10-13_8_21_14_all_63_91]PJA12199.1 MAG: 16S rRNA (cytidine(1402)-2'-O)-methyltransferase [Elusimicrobia bacterium CG_4_10_14_0_2_um_filter_63_34]PJB23464.1 MAG: 16S rRNA (cytidine(1402)-2'-O)-methyltransferase [Elusimicrobia bacterium CG_4_9_14_3_um_filter_62_55]
MLTVVPTPLGNLEDMTRRGLTALEKAAVVYSEDTRRTRQLLTHFGIRTPVERYQDRDPRLIERILQRLAAGEEIALASDAGTPVISDPGVELVGAARRAGLPVTALPGACAAPTAVAGSGLPGDAFVFLGFLPRTPGKQRRALEAAAALGKTLVIYESPFRVRKLLERAAEALGSDAQAAFVRELSKLHEEWRTGSIASLLASLPEGGHLKGEFVVMLHPRAAREKTR